MSTKIKAIGIVGSYRKGNIVDSAVTEILAEAERQGLETKKIYLQDQKIRVLYQLPFLHADPRNPTGEVRN